MAVLISLLRGVNVGGHNIIQMEALRQLYASLELRDAQTYVQSGNVVFKTDEPDLVLLARRLEEAIEHRFGFRPGVVVRTRSELRGVIARNPFVKRSGIDPSKLLVVFLSSDPGPVARELTMSMEAAPEEFRIDGREVYIYYPDGMARPKLPWALIEKRLKVSGTGRNWNTVGKLSEMAEKLEALP